MSYSVSHFMGIHMLEVVYGGDVHPKEVRTVHRLIFVALRCLVWVGVNDHGGIKRGGDQPSLFSIDGC